MKYFLLLFTLIVLSSCATVFKDSRQQVFFKGGPEKGITTINSPDGKVEIENGSGTYLMTRSKSDIPIKVTCPNGEVKQDILETKFDILVAAVLNLIIFWPSLFYDPFQAKAYDIPEIQLGRYCK